MPTTDTSFAARNRILASRTLALFHRNNPTAKEQGASPLDESGYLVRRMGGMHNIVQPPSGPRIDETGCGCAPCAAPGQVSNIVLNATASGPDPDTIYISVEFDAAPNATSYTITATSPILSITTITATSYSVLIYWPTPYPDVVFTVIANNTCGSSPGESGTIAPCFLAGSLVTLADGTQKVIEEIAVGDLVLGAFGEVNEVLALHRPVLGSYYMVHINGDHYSSAHHPHITTDAKFVCAEPAVVDNETYGREHTVINADGEEELRMLHGLAKGRVQQLAVGAALKTVGGSRVVESLERADMPPETQLYNLVVGGSHTYHVDGYAVTGWPREDDFDYDAWVKRSDHDVAA